jgi:hypothetical protein
MHVAMDGPPRYQPRSKIDDQMRHARTCYDDIAGVLGVALADSMTARDFVLARASNSLANYFPRGRELKFLPKWQLARQQPLESVSHLSASSVLILCSTTAQAEKDA